MIVLDASVVVEMVTNGPESGSIREKLAGSPSPYLAPHILDVEVVGALRGLVAGHRVDGHSAHLALRDLALLPVERYSHWPMLDRIWELRHNFSAYDAAYIALAEMTDSILFTCDRRLAKGHRAAVTVLP